MVGRHFDSRSLTVGMLPYKRTRLLALLLEWQDFTEYSLPQIASLIGQLDHLTRYARWARCWYFALSNAVRGALHTRYHILSRANPRFDAKITSWKSVLPQHLSHRLATLISRDKAAFLWSKTQTFKVSPALTACLHHLHRYISSTSTPWSVHLGLVVPRRHHFESFGDASTSHGGGAFSPELRFWFDIAWTPRVLAGCKFKSSQPGFVHINSLEFIVLILQLAAIRTRLDTPTGLSFPLAFPNGMPSIPVWLGWTDNTASKAWESRATTKGSQGQALVSVYAELLRTSHIHTQCSHIKGERNVIADDISRNDFSLSFSSRLSKLTAKHPSLASYDFFQPSRALLSLLTSRLFSGPSLDPCELPKTLGHFVPAGSTTSTLPSL